MLWTLRQSKISPCGTFEEKKKGRNSILGFFSVHKANRLGRLYVEGRKLICTKFCAGSNEASWILSGRSFVIYKLCLLDVLTHMNLGKSCESRALGCFQCSNEGRIKKCSVLPLKSLEA